MSLLPDNIIDIIPTPWDPTDVAESAAFGKAVDAAETLQKARKLFAEAYEFFRVQMLEYCDLQIRQASEDVQKDSQDFS